MEPEIVALVCFLYYFWWNAVRIDQQEIQRRKSNTDSRNRRMKLQADRHWRNMTQMVELLRCAQRRRQRVIHHYLSSRRKTRSVWAHVRSSDWWERVALHFTDEEWLHEFRLSRETFYFICNKLKKALERKDTSFRLCIPLNKKVAMAIWKLATTSEYRTVGDMFGVSVTSVCRCVHEFCKAVIQVLLPELIAVPDQEKLAEIAELYERQWGVPQCVGAIGGTHIPIIRPSKFQADYHNPKGWHSVVLQAVVDANGMFWDVCVGIPGSTHTADALRRSDLWTLANSCSLFPGRTRNICGRDIGYYLIGDSAYPLQSWLVKPFPDSESLGESQQRFNYWLSCARSEVEHAFGRLKGRWRCLTKRNDCSVDVVKTMILTCCVLHNLCEKHRETYRPEWNTVEQPMCALPQRDGTEGEDVRDTLLQYFSSFNY